MVDTFAKTDRFQDVSAVAAGTAVAPFGLSSDLLLGDALLLLMGP
jgi:hypothetical protein